MIGDPSHWISYHLFYHGNRDRLLRGMVRPLVTRLWSGGRIDRFYFIRYALGGPHVRLRLRTVPGMRESAAHETTMAASSFFKGNPSVVTQSEDEIRRTNQNLLANDSYGEDEVYPNDSCFEFPFHVEEQRYGGEALLDASLDFFTISSCHVLRFLESSGDQPHGTKLALALQILARIALGLAHDSAEFLDIVQYASVWSRGDGALFVDRANQAFDQAPGSPSQALRREIEVFLSPASERSESLPPLLEAARALARAISPADKAVRRQIARGQIHMTANRLGLINPEEIYLGRLLWRAAEHIAATDSGLWQSLTHAWTRPSTPESLERQVHAAVEGLL